MKMCPKCGRNTENEAIELHIKENIHRIEVIEEFLRTNSDAADKECKKNIQILTKINGALSEIQQYRSIGTVAECREAVEKHKPKMPNIWGDGYADGQLVYDMYDCPNCGESYEIDYDHYDYCPKCGQRIDRTDLEKMEE